MNNYDNYWGETEDLLKYHSEKIFDTQIRFSNEGFNVEVDGAHQEQVLIQMHSNPINDRLEDKKLCLPVSRNKSINWGSLITGYDSAPYLVITPPYSTDGIMLRCKIRKTTDKVKFSIDEAEYIYDGIVANYLLYDEKSYVTDLNVFEEDDRLACVVKYDETTSKLKLFNDIIIDGARYKITKIDKCIDNDFQHGVIQLVVVRTIFGEISVRNQDYNYSLIDGLIRFTKMKERIYNSKAREILTYHNVLKTGDYIKHRYVRDEKGNMEERIYLVSSEVDMKNEYDTTFILHCGQTINLKNKDGVIVPYPINFNDNKTMLKDSSVGAIEGYDASSIWGTMRDDSVTARLGRSIKRVLIKKENSEDKEYNAYKIVGREDLSLDGVVTLSFERDDLHPQDDMVNGIAYNFEKENSESVDEIKGQDIMLFDLEEEYTIENKTEYVTSWSVDVEDVKILSEEKEKCTLVCVYKKDLLGKKFKLKARINHREYAKEIELAN